jgi:hypothetical protein
MISFETAFNFNSHGDHFLDTRPTISMSLCKTVCWLRLSHFRVTPDQFILVTVAWSFCRHAEGRKP